MLKTIIKIILSPILFIPYWLLVNLTHRCDEIHTFSEVWEVYIKGEK